MLKAMKENDKGVYFPVWGCCMGFQQMLILADGNDDVDNFLQRFDSYNNLLLPIKFTEEGNHSTFVKGIDTKTYKKLKNTKSTMNNHKLGITPYKMKKNKKVHAFYKIVGTSKDRKGREFVACGSTLLTALAPQQCMHVELHQQNWNWQPNAPKDCQQR